MRVPTGGTFVPSLELRSAVGGNGGSAGAPLQNAPGARLTVTNIGIARHDPTPC